MSLLKSVEMTNPVQEMVHDILDRPALLFSGQGSQTQGMGKDLAENDSDAMNYWKDAEKISGLPLREIYWDGTEEDMNDTKALQPALTVVNLNLWRAFQKHTNIIPAAAAGHSLGEFSALTAANVISPRSALELTALRGRLMAEADPLRIGAMAAIVKLEQPIVLDIVKEAGAESGELIVPANYNTPLQLVISGHQKAVDLACKKAKEHKGRAMPLKVSGAFHSPLMEEANKEFAPLVEKTEFKNPRFPVYSNVTAKAATTGEEAKKNILRQMVSPVFWVDMVRNLYAAGVRWWVEMSPRAVLGKMLGPAMSGVVGYLNTWRVDIISSLQNILTYVT